MVARSLIVATIAVADPLMAKLNVRDLPTPGATDTLTTRFRNVPAHGHGLLVMPDDPPPARPSKLNESLTAPLRVATERRIG